MLANGEAHHKHMQGNTVLYVYKMKSGIYVITNKVSGHQYVGQTNDLKRRRWEHFNPNSEHNFLLRRAYSKHGLEQFSYEVLEYCPVDKLDERERFWISKLKPVYNLTDGGNGRSGFHCTEKTKEILREAGKRQWERKTDEEKAAFVKSNLKGPKAGHEVSLETREKIRKSKRGVKEPEDKKQKRMAAVRASGLYEKLHEARKRKVICKETGEIFDSVKSAMKKYGGTVSPHLRGKYKTCKGFHFEYLECRD